MTAADDEIWTGKQDAAKLLGVSVRQLEVRAARGEIRKKTLPRALNERTARVMYSVADIEAIRAGKQTGYATWTEADGTKQAAPLAPDFIDARGLTVKQTRAAIEARDPFAGLAAQLAALARAFPSPAPPAPERYWLTLAEASEVSGLPAAWLLDSARIGASFAVNTARKGGRARWRFNREALRQVTPTAPEVH